MKGKRKILLIFTISLIVISYGFAINLIVHHPGKATEPSNPPKKYSGYKSSKPKRELSPYYGNQLHNGASPFNECFGNGFFSGNATLTIKNGASSDAIVCLYSLSLRRTIRNEYVRKNSSYTMSSISQGRYKIKVFYGNDWNPERLNPCGYKGYFDSDVYFSEFDGTEYFEDSYDGYTVATVTLYTVSGGNASTSRINQSDFFNN